MRLLQQAVAVNCVQLTGMLDWSVLTADVCWGRWLGCLTEVALCSFTQMESLHSDVPRKAIRMACNACTSARP